MKNLYGRVFILLALSLISTILSGCTNPKATVSVPTTNLLPLSTAKSPPTPVVVTEITPTLYKTATSTPKPTRTPLPPPSPTSTEISGQELLQQIHFKAASVSPHGDWAAVVAGSRSEFIMQVFNQTGGGPSWSIGEQKELSVRYIPWPFAWSQDGQSLYYTHQLRGGDGCLGYWAFNGRDLYKLDLATGESIQLSPPVGNWIALSPDEKLLGYLTSDRIGILELESGQSREAEVERPQDPSTISHLVHMVWAPDGRYLLFGLLSNLCVDEDLDRYSLLKVNTATFEQETLIDESSEWLQPIAWPEPDRVLIRDESGEYWWFNLWTRQMEKK